MVACHVTFQCQLLILVLFEKKKSVVLFKMNLPLCLWTPCRQNIIIEQKLKLTNILSVWLLTCLL